MPFSYVASTLVNTVCPMLNNLPSCCPDPVIAAVENAFNIARARVVLAKAEMDAIRLHSAAIDVEFNTLRSEIDKKEAAGEMTAEVATALRNFVNRVQEALQNFIGRVTTTFIKCLESILTYLAGVVCFGCDVNWQNYTVYYNANNSIVIVVNQATCDSMNGGCIDFYLSFVQLVVDLRNAGAQLSQDLGTPISVPSWRNPCYNGTLANDTVTNGARCKDFICQRLIHGADSEEPDTESSREANLKHDVDAAAHLLSKSFGHARAAVGGVVADRVLDRALLLLRSAHSAHASSQRAMREASNQETSYSSDGGVDLYQLGTQSGLNKSTGSASMLTVTTFLFGLIAALALLF